MKPGIRSFGLTAHVLSSVGWFGAVVVFILLAIVGLTSRDVQMVRAAYLAMKLTAWFVIVPFAFASLLTGVVQSLGTTWGLFRHYWILAKLLLTVAATIVLLRQLQRISDIAGVAAATILSGADLHWPRADLLVHAGGGMLVLLVATTLAVYKPRGMVHYWAPKQHRQQQ